MSLADFIEKNIEPILMEWEKFASEIWPTDAAVMPKELRDDAESILRATVADMRSAQSERQRELKSHGEGKTAEESSPMNRASVLHGSGRVDSGFDIGSVVAEYRSLRASIIRLWRDSKPAMQDRDLEDLTRLNESIDQSLTHAIDAFVKQQRERDADAAREHERRIVAEAANLAKDLFLATLSHELRTPLSAIIGWISILRSEDRDESDLAEGLEVIDRSSRAQAQLIDDVLDVSRINAGKLRIKVRSCDLAEVIRDGVEAVRAAAEAREITLEVDLDPAASHARCDATRMQQVVWNLVSNAVKFTPRGGRVQVTLRCAGTNTQIQVSDNGQGIDPQVLPYIFDRFRQADSSTRRQFAGLGLGLSIVRYLVEAHGGIVEAYSAGEGQGSTFTVLLPHPPGRDDQSHPEQSPAKVLSDTKADAVAPVFEGDPPGHDVADKGASLLARLDGLTLLVVDDEPDARRLLARLLGNLGAHVITATGTAEALELLPGLNPDVLISDIGMPGMDGLDLIREVRHLDMGDLPTIALTALAHRDDVRRILAAGYDVHVAKPVDAVQLTTTIARLAREKRRAHPRPDC